MQMSRQQPEIVQIFEVKIVLCHWHMMIREGDGHSNPWTHSVARPTHHHRGDHLWWDHYRSLWLCTQTVTVFQIWMS